MQLVIPGRWAVMLYGQLTPLPVQHLTTSSKADLISGCQERQIWSKPNCEMADLSYPGDNLVLISFPVERLGLNDQQLIETVLHLMPSLAGNW